MHPNPESTENTGSTEVTANTEVTEVIDPSVLAGVHEALLVPNFPASELITAAALVDSVAAGTRVVRVVGDTDDPLAIAVTETFEGSPATLLAYFATRADQRGRGIGSGLLRSLLTGIAAEPGVSVVLAEVEHPDHHPAHEVHGDPAARLRFYGRLGGLILDVPYFQPPVDASQDAVYGMLLLALDPPDRWVRRGPDPEAPARLVPDAGLQAALEAIMAGVDRGVFPAESTLEPARDPEGTALWPLDRLGEVPVSRRPPSAPAE